MHYAYCVEYYVFQLLIVVQLTVTTCVYCSAGSLPLLPDTKLFCTVVGIQFQTSVLQQLQVS